MGSTGGTTRFISSTPTLRIAKFKTTVPSHLEKSTLRRTRLFVLIGDVVALNDIPCDTELFINYCDGYWFSHFFDIDLYHFNILEVYYPTVAEALQTYKVHMLN